VIIDVVAVVRRLVPGLLTHARPSVVWVRTTHPKYLVFDGDTTHPACVVEFGDAERLCRIDRILSELYRRCPGVVPRPLICARWDDQTAVQIQEGLPGMPWFRVADGLTTSAAWESLLDRAMGASRLLHAAIASVPAWVGTVDVHEALAEQVRLCRAGGAGLDPGLLRHVEECGGRLAEIGPVPARFQHGDFSLNNLLVTAGGAAVIDFEEFGLTKMPLHDALGLALSFPLSQVGRCPRAIADCFNRCITATIAAEPYGEATRRGLLLHHVLWRINQCHGHPTRAPLRARMVSIAERVAGAPGDGLLAVTSAFA
jgi:hypothetical protein